jgi:NTP pyrophosphatase (non-canonical NTP hydrolase)
VLLKPYQQREFISSFFVVAEEIHATAFAKGFWPAAGRNDGEMLMLAVSELGECLEGLRHGNPPSDHIPEFSAAEEEIADCFIRLMDTSHARGWRVAEAILAKMEFNNGRAFKHGKAF